MLVNKIPQPEIFFSYLTLSILHILYHFDAPPFYGTSSLPKLRMSAFDALLLRLFAA